MSKHTPGPWEVAVNGSSISIEAQDMPTWRQCWPNTSSEGHVFVCRFRDIESPCMRDYYAPGAKLLLETNIANAHLISAAPAMLQLLKHLKESLCSSLGVWRVMIEEVEAKAEGRGQ